MRIPSTFLILLMAVVWIGCGSVRDVPINNRASIEASRVNRAVAGKLARVHMRDGTRTYAMGVRVRPDSTTWMEPHQSVYHTVATEDVNKITIVRAGQGAIVGLGTGIVIGVATGVLRAQQEGDDPVDDFPSLSKERKMATYSIAHSAYASLVTTPLGAVIGRKNTYRIVRD